MENIVTLLGEDKAEPEKAIAEAGGVVAAISRATAPGTAEPATTADHAVRPTRRSGGISLQTAAVPAIPVLTPLPYIAGHFIDAELVGRLGGN